MRAFRIGNRRGDRFIVCHIDGEEAATDGGRMLFAQFGVEVENGDPGAPVRQHPCGGPAKT